VHSPSQYISPRHQNTCSRGNPRERRQNPPVGVWAIGPGSFSTSLAGTAIPSRLTPWRSGQDSVGATQCLNHHTKESATVTRNTPQGGTERNLDPSPTVAAPAREVLKDTGPIAHQTDGGLSPQGAVASGTCHPHVSPTVPI
jgi:hypothetical protein